MAEEPINLEPITDEERPWDPEFDQKPYDIWNEVLQPGSHVTPAEAAKRINELFPVRKPEHTDKSYGESASQFLWNFWDLLIQVVQLLPHDHQAQTKVVLILEELTRLPPITVEQFSTFGKRVWTDLPFLGPSMRDSWSSPTWKGEIPDKDSAQLWINQNAFAARLLNKGLGGWPNFAVWEVRAVLEEPAMDRAAMNCNVVTAAGWILYGGEAVFKYMSKDMDEEEARWVAAGSLFPGKSGSLRERWKFWKIRFAAVSQQVDEDVREQAIRAVEKMEKLEQVGT